MASVEAARERLERAMIRLDQAVRRIERRNAAAHDAVERAEAERRRVEVLKRDVSERLDTTISRLRTVLED